MINSIKNLTYDEMQKWAIQKGLKPFVGRQIFEWLFSKNVESIDSMRNIAKNIRNIIEKEGPLSLLELKKHEVNEDDSTEKFLFSCLDGNAIESVLIRSAGRNTVCVSSQIGCAMGCTFCRTADMGILRDLSSGEIVEQVIQITRLTHERVTNVVFMGMGEPFNNYQEVIKAATVLNHEKGLNIGARHITISTAGIVPRIREFSHLPYQFKLAISLNVANDEKRNELMPINRRYSLRELLETAKYYTDITNKLITFEYVLISGVNNTQKDAQELIKHLSHIPSKLNIIPFNEIDSKFQRPNEQDILTFMSYFKGVSFAVTLRNSGGKGIQAACGQLYHEAFLL